MRAVSTIVRRACPLAIALAALLAPGAATAVDFTEAELTALKAGEVVRHELPSSRRGGFYGGSSFAIVDAPIGAVWKAIQDWSAYPKAFPNTTETVELSRKGERSLVRMKIGHPVASVQYHVEMTRDARKRILAFAMVKELPNDLDDVRGYWRLFEQPGGRTLVAYVVAVRAPMGLVNLVGPELGARAVAALLNVPGSLKAWIEGPGAARYR